MNAPAPVYEVRGVEHRFNGRLALRCAALTVQPASVVGLCGPNGAGKSTLLMVMSFLLEPTAGEVIFLGQPGRPGDVALRRRAVLMPQDPALLHRRVADNVLYGLSVRGEARSESLREALELVGLAPRRYHRRWWWELSGGESRRVALAARLALHPTVLLLDEPTASLDPASAERVREAVLTARQQRGMSCVVVNHDRQWLDATCDVVHELEPQAGIRG